MTDQERAAMQQALEALYEADTFHRNLPDQRARRLAAMTALRAALAQQDEPVATVAENATTQQFVGETPPSDYRRGYWDGFNIGKREGRIEAEDALAQQAEPQDAELSAALGWPGGISELVLDRKTLLRQVADLRAALAQPVPHGCHVDLDDDMEPDGCVLDEGSPRKCVHAGRLLREGKNKTACNYWKPIEVKR